MPRFPKEERLLTRTEFLGISARGRKIHTPDFIILWEKSDCSLPRIGITVSRKVGNAVVRNRIKRLVREFYRLNKRLFATADYNVIAKPGAARLDFHGISKELGRALQRLDI